MIKINISMPISCHKCPFKKSMYDGRTCMFSDFDEKERCFKMDTSECNDKRHENCPLIESDD